MQATTVRFRTMLHGACLVNGHHPPGSLYARECPVRRQAPPEPASRPPTSLVEAPNLISEGSWGGERLILQPAPPAHRGGRPRKYQTRRAAVRAAVRAYRARRTPSS
jgi:hypothetical protein